MRRRRRPRHREARPNPIDPVQAVRRVPTHRIQSRQQHDAPAAAASQAKGQSPRPFACPVPAGLRAPPPRLLLLQIPTRPPGSNVLARSRARPSTSSVVQCNDTPRRPTAAPQFGSLCPMCLLWCVCRRCESLTQESVRNQKGHAQGGRSALQQERRGRAGGRRRTPIIRSLDIDLGEKEAHVSHRAAGQLAPPGGSCGCWGNAPKRH